MEELLNAYEEKRKREMRVDDVIVGNVLEVIKKEIKIQKFTRAGYHSKHIRCHKCRNVWLALYDDKGKAVRCPYCKTVISIKASKEY